MSTRVSTPRTRTLIVLVVALIVAGCAPSESAVTERAVPTPPDFACDPDDGGITLTDGFCATVFADEVGAAWHLAVTAAGDLYVAMRPTFQRSPDGRQMTSPGGVTVMRDSDGDGKADVIESVNEVAGTGVALHDGYLYYSSTREVYRVALTDGELLPTGEPELLVEGFPNQGQHASKPMVFDGAGNMYVTVGAPSNACQETMRTPGSSGEDPCSQRELQAGIWRFDDARPGQTHLDGSQYASGIRNALALDWSSQANALFALQHGRDSLHDLWGDLFTLEASAELPAEEMFRVHEGDDFGWPYCYYDSVENAKVLSPEYGGDGSEVGRCGDVAETLVAFPAHWAPNDLILYGGGTFPEHYEGGAFVAFHGSWNRMPFPQQGYNVVFVPLDNGPPAGQYEVFADGFAGMEEISLQQAQHRPTGLAQGPDGSLYISSDFRQGRI